MNLSIRPYQASDIEPVVALSLLAWAPVFVSLRNVVGQVLAERLFPDWRKSQEDVVRLICGDAKYTVLVADLDGVIAGFLAYELKEESKQGETQLLAVHPDHQNEDVGAAVKRAARAQMKTAGMTVAVVETGGDIGHAPARACYEKSGYTLLPIARYFQAL